MALEIPRGQFITIPGIYRPVVPEIYPFETRIKARRATQAKRNDAVEIDDSRDIFRIRQQLQMGREDGFFDLASVQPLVKSGLVHPEQMREILYRYGGMFSQSRRIMGELAAVTPNPEDPDLLDATIYRGGWRVKPGSKFDLSVPNLEQINLVIPAVSAVDMDDDLRKVFGVPDSVEASYHIVRPERTPGEDVKMMSLSWEMRGPDFVSLRIRPADAKLDRDLSVIGLGKNIDTTLNGTAGNGEELGKKEQELIEKEIEERFCTDVFGGYHYSRLPVQREALFSTVTQEAAERSITLTPGLVSILLRRTDESRTVVFERWVQIQREIAEGGFDPKNPTHIDLQFGKFRGWRQGTYEQYIRFADSHLKGVDRIQDDAFFAPDLHLSLKERQEAVYQGYESLLLLDFLSSVAEKVKDWDGRLVVATNLTTGLWGVEPIRDLLSPDIPVFETRFSSGNGEITLMPAELREIIAGGQDVIAFVDGTKDVNDAHDRTINQRPRSFRHFRDYALHAISESEDSEYMVKQWNPGNLLLTLDAGKRPLEVANPYRVDRPTILLTNYTMPAGSIPEWLTGRIRAEHSPAFFDDWTKIQNDLSRFGSRGLEILSGRSVLIDEIKTVMTRHFKGGAVTPRF